jgi:fatty-acyl-CoA synthase
MELLEITIAQQLERNAHQHPDGLAAVFMAENRRFTWSELHQAVTHFAAGLQAAGIGRGAHVAIWGTNTPLWLLTQLATARLGGVLVTLNPEWQEQELVFALQESDAELLVLQSAWEKTVRNKVFRYDYVSMLHHLCPALPAADFPRLKKIIVEADAPAAAGYLALSDMLLMAEAQPLLPDMPTEPHDVALLQFTSGTTGFPKGAMLTHRNVLNNALAAALHMGIQPEDKICGPVPFYHCFGSILFVLGALVSGAAMVVPAPVFDAHQTLEAIQREKCTALYGVPTMFITELGQMDFDAFDLSSLRTGIMAGAPVDKVLFEAVTHRMGARGMTIAYGLTEASPITHQTWIEDPLDMRINTVGKPIEHTLARIVNPGDFRTLGVGELGEIWVKGWHVMKGYYQKPEETARAIVEDGWLRTGDLGVVDEQGYYRIVGRLKEMFIVGGHNVYPAEVEQALYKLLESEARMLQVVGVPDPTLQEVAALVISFKPGQLLTLTQIQARCAGKLEWPKIPRYMKVLDDFSEAMTVTGKIQKFKLVDLFRDNRPPHR